MNSLDVIRAPTLEPHSLQTKQITNILNKGDSLQLQVIEKLNRQRVKLDGQIGSILIEVPNTDLLEEGSYWKLQSNGRGKYHLLTEILNSENFSKLNNKVNQSQLSVLGKLSSDTIEFKTTSGKILLKVESPQTFLDNSKWILERDLQHNYILKSTNHNAKIPGEQKLVFPATFILDVTKYSKNKTPSFQIKNVKQNSLDNQQRLLQSINAFRQEAAQKQNSLAGLYSNLSNLITTDNLSAKQPNDIQTLRTLAQQILGLRLGSNITANDIKKAIQTSGIFNEGQHLIAHHKFHSQDATKNLKQLLYLLKNTIPIATEKPSYDHSLLSKPPALPEKEGAINGQKPLPPSSNLKDSNFLNKLADQTTQALSRIKLLQLNSLSQYNTSTHELNSENIRVVLNLELPISIAHDQTAIVGLRITDDSNQHTDQSKFVKNWSVDLALDTEETGNINVHLKLKSNTFNITLWLENKEFAAQLKANSEKFIARILEEGFEVQRFDIHVGKRPQTNAHYQQQVGSYLDHNI